MNNPDHQAEEIVNELYPETLGFEAVFCRVACRKGATKSLQLKHKEIEKLEARVKELDEAISQWAEQRTTGSEFIMLEAIANNEDRA